MDAFRSPIRLDALSGLIKKWYTTFLGLLMTVLTAVLSAQSVLTSKADNLQMKGVKYAVSNILPVVGGAVSGTLGTVAAGIGVLRSTCGVCGVILIGLLLLPTLIQLLLYRAVFQLTGTAAGMLRCEGEAKLLGEVASLYGYVAAVVSICSVAFVVALSLLIGGTAAIA
jgi:stage III sporulation protein AE